ncbi:MAG: PilZ domain-containing protein [Acidobacteriia bacterium]|nr:PilZ domain-containing protein [Terriglobia bacterium]
MAAGRSASEPQKKGATGGRRERRVILRARARLLVRFGIAAPEKTGFTKNVSESGLFVHTNQVFEPGTTIQLKVQFPDGPFSFWGRVMWAKQVPPQLAHLLDCGMGIRFLEPSPEWLAYYEKWKRKFGL